MLSTEGAAEADLESWLRESHMEPREMTRVMRQMSYAERSYATYADEPLTSTTDSLAWMPRF